MSSAATELDASNSPRALRALPSHDHMPTARNPAPGAAPRHHFVSFTTVTAPATAVSLETAYSEGFCRFPNGVAEIQQPELVVGMRAAKARAPASILTRYRGGG